MARYNVKNMFAQDNKWFATLENGMKVRGIGQSLEVYTKKSKKFKKLSVMPEHLQTLSVNRHVAITQIEKVFGKLAIVKTLEGKQVKLAELETGKRGRKSLSFYGV